MALPCSVTSGVTSWPFPTVKHKDRRHATERQRCHQQLTNANGKIAPKLEVAQPTTTEADSKKDLQA